MCSRWMKCSRSCASAVILRPLSGCCARLQASSQTPLINLGATMSNALAIAASGLKVHDRYIDSLAHDLANLSTNNYKATTLRFGAEMDATQKAGPHNLGVRIMGTDSDFSKGPLKPTDSSLDVAIDGEGFFQVEDADGTVAFTRTSTLMLDSEGYLATADGLRLAESIQVPPDHASLVIHKNGEVEITRSDTDAPELLGTIQLARFQNPQALHALHAGVWQATPDSGDALIDNPGSGGNGELLQKTVEGSNVDMVNTLMQLTMAQRVYQLNAKAIQVADELEKTINALRD
ncbi:flagellar hook-basal body complex protein [Legionella geestiana]|nr:flagellar hook-basal body complex protein [Legionella geestiana]